MKRSTTDLLVLMIAGTVCAAILVTIVALSVSEFYHPNTDTSKVAGAIVNVINTMIGLLAGFLAGRTRTRKKNGDPE